MTIRSRYLLAALCAAALPGLAFAQAPATSADIAAVTKEVHGVHNDIVYQNGLTGAKLDTLHNDMQALTKALQSAGTVIGSTTSPVVSTPVVSTPVITYAGDVVTAFDPCAGMAAKWSVLKLAPSASIANALVCAAPGFNLLLEPGVYKQVFHVPDGLGGSVGGDVAAGGTADTVKLDGRGGCTVSQNNGGGCSTRLAYGKGVVHVSSTFLLHDVEVMNGGINAMGDHDGQAGLYIDAGGAAGTVTATHVMFRHNENGVFANTNSPHAVVLIEDDFVENGTDGGSHSSYVSGGPSLTLTRIHDYGSYQGNNQKVRVPVVVATDIWSKSTQGRWIEGADGATITITGGTFIGNTCCQNVYGNGTESTSKGPGNTTWSNSAIWLGRASNFANTGTFIGTGLTVTCAAGAYAANDHGGDLTGLPSCPANSNTPQPADAPFISGAKS